MSNRKPVKQIKNKNLNYDQYRILSVCYNLLYVNRERLQRILGIKNKRTINKKLQHLNEYFDIYKYGSYVYRLNAKGRDILGVKPHKGIQTLSTLYSVMKHGYTTVALIIGKSNVHWNIPTIEKNIQLFLMRCLVRAVPYFCRN